jgi:biofilm protein TabA
MTFDLLNNKHLYPYGDAWMHAFRFLSSLNADTEEKRYDLIGDSMYAIVESYLTKSPEVARPEAHQKYVDIQVLISGAERIGWHPVSELSVATPYDYKTDIAFYDPQPNDCTALAMTPGRFALFLPTDAHVPGLHPNTEPTAVKKCIIKMAVDLL